MKKIFVLLVLIMANLLWANNISIGSITLVNRDTTARTAVISFDVSWENSWRLDTAPANWDAAWIFMKFKDADGEWHHATLAADTSGFTPAPGATIQPVADRKGFFLYRSEVGSGEFNAIGNQLTWYYGEDSLANSDIIEIKLFGIEMIYIPEGAFYAGSTTSDSGDVNFLRRISGTDTSAFLVDTALVDSITSEGTGVSDSQDDDVLKGINGYTGIGIDGDDGLDADNDGVIDNPDFPTGYKAFYLMKYEITQQQYVEFLNTLTRAQQVNHVATIDTGLYALTNTSTVSDRNGIRVPSSYEDGPIQFGCDLNENKVMNESDDGQNIAVNYLNWQDVAAYLDWAALRPYTELEFVKAARGPLAQSAGEFVWGTKYYKTEDYDGILNAGTEDEVTANSDANVHTAPQGVGGPLRAGCFARATSDRENAGSGYYGNLDLSGNVWELVIPLGNTDGRNFTGVHGDGELDATSGYANVTNWPALNQNGSVGKRGGVFIGPIDQARIANRNYANFEFYISSRRYDDGGRGARTAP